MMETAAYYIALVTLVTVPPMLFYWFLIHPFIRLWRKLPLWLTYSIVIPIALSLGLLCYLLREPLLSCRFGIRPELFPGAAIFLIVSAIIASQRAKYLSLPVMLGIPEIAGAARPADLFREGIYRKLRHPRYLEGFFLLASISLFTNYLALYILLIAYIPLIYCIVIVEELELRARFGERYERYCREVPRFIPKIRW